MNPFLGSQPRPVPVRFTGLDSKPTKLYGESEEGRSALYPEQHCEVPLW